MSANCEPKTIKLRFVKAGEFDNSKGINFKKNQLHSLLNRLDFIQEQLSDLNETCEKGKEITTLKAPGEGALGDANWFNTRDCFQNYFDPGSRAVLCSKSSNKFSCPKKRREYYLEVDPCKVFKCQPSLLPRKKSSCFCRYSSPLCRQLDDNRESMRKKRSRKTAKKWSLKNLLPCHSDSRRKVQASSKKGKSAKSRKKKRQSTSSCKSKSSIKSKLSRMFSFTRKSASLDQCSSRILEHLNYEKRKPRNLCKNIDKKSKKAKKKQRKTWENSVEFVCSKKKKRPKKRVKFNETASETCHSNQSQGLKSCKHCRKKNKPKIKRESILRIIDRKTLSCDSVKKYSKPDQHKCQSITKHFDRNGKRCTERHVSRVKTSSSSLCDSCSDLQKLMVTKTFSYSCPNIGARQSKSKKKLANKTCSIPSKSSRMNSARQKKSFYNPLQSFGPRYNKHQNCKRKRGKCERTMSSIPFTWSMNLPRRRVEFTENCKLNFSSMKFIDKNIDDIENCFTKQKKKNRIGLPTEFFQNLNQNPLSCSISPKIFKVSVFKRDLDMIDCKNTSNMRNRGSKCKILSTFLESTAIDHRTEEKMMSAMESNKFTVGERTDEIVRSKERVKGANRVKTNNSSTTVKKIPSVFSSKMPLVLGPEEVQDFEAVQLSADTLLLECPNKYDDTYDYQFTVDENIARVGNQFDSVISLKNLHGNKDSAKTIKSFNSFLDPIVIDMDQTNFDKRNSKNCSEPKFQIEATKKAKELPKNTNKLCNAYGRQESSSRKKSMRKNGGEDSYQKTGRSDDEADEKNEWRDMETVMKKPLMGKQEKFRYWRNADGIKIPDSASELGDSKYTKDIRKSSDNRAEFGQQEIRGCSPRKEKSFFDRFRSIRSFKSDSGNIVKSKGTEGDEKKNGCKLVNSLATSISTMLRNQMVQQQQKIDEVQTAMLECMNLLTTLKKSS